MKCLHRKIVSALIIFAYKDVKIEVESEYNQKITHDYNLSNPHILRMTKESPIPISVRLPQDLYNEVERIRTRDRMDRTNLIIKAVEYWVGVDGQVVTDNELLTRLNKIDRTTAESASLIKDYQTEIETYRKDVEELKAIVAQQNTLLDLLLNKILDRK